MRKLECYPHEWLPLKSGDRLAWKFLAISLIDHSAGDLSNGYCFQVTIDADSVGGVPLRSNKSSS